MPITNDARLNHGDDRPICNRSTSEKQPTPGEQRPARVTSPRLHPLPPWPQLRAAAGGGRERTKTFPVWGWVRLLFLSLSPSGGGRGRGRAGRFWSRRIDGARAGESDREEEGARAPRCNEFNVSSPGCRRHRRRRARLPTRALTVAVASPPRAPAQSTRLLGARAAGPPPPPAAAAGRTGGCCAWQVISRG